MTHRERVAAALRGDPVDRPPVSMWRHFYRDEQTSAGLVLAMLAFQRAYDWDFLKVNPRASYHLEDWGYRVRYPVDSNAGPEVASSPIEGPEDWLKLRPLDVRQGVLGEHLAALRAIVKELRGEAPVLMTVFTPLSIAARLAPDAETAARHMREHPQQFAHALEVVTETFTRFAHACLDAGASGLFFATTLWATRDRLSEDEYRRFGRPYDLRVLDAVRDAEFNLMHVCKDHNMLALLKDYPVHTFNWDADGKENLTLAQGRELTGRCVAGGVPHHRALPEMTPQEISQRVHGLVGEMGGQRGGWMLASGCTYAPATPEANVRAARDAVR